VRRRAAALIDDVIEAGECDFVADIAAPLPALVICDMMGIPESEVGFVLDCANIIVGAADRKYFPIGKDPLDVQVEAVQGLEALMAELAEERLRSPKGDLITQLLRADAEGEMLDERELASFFVLLVAAGSETTRTALSQGMKALCDHADQRAMWARDFDGLADIAIEEILRWSSPVLNFRRTATRDTEVGGQRIHAGERVVMWYVSANRDAAAFDEPNRFDILRTPNEHVAFGGGGAHHCLGASLARLEIAVLFREVFQRLQDFELSGEPKMQLSNFTNGIKSMPCRFASGARLLRR
jgi:cytochrome P450